MFNLPKPAAGSSGVAAASHVDIMMPPQFESSLDARRHIFPPLGQIPVDVGNFLSNMRMIAIVLTQRKREEWERSE
eukprot:10105730-Alexandrium_andersonii.AAC.1